MEYLGLKLKTELCGQVLPSLRRAGIPETEIQTILDCMNEVAGADTDVSELLEIIQKLIKEKLDYVCIAESYKTKIVDDTRRIDYLEKAYMDTLMDCKRINTIIRELELKVLLQDRKIREYENRQK